MAILNANKSTITTTTVRDYEVDANSLDYSSSDGETFWEFNEATNNFGYYFSIPELKKAIDILATWTAGKGWEASSELSKVELEHLSGWGEDTFQSILWNLIVTKKIVGDAFAEIIRNKGGDLINLKPISPERVRLVLDGKGLIKRYDVRKVNGEYQAIQTKDILHLCNDRIGDQIHGTSVIDAVKWVIDARNEALNDERMIKHRELAMGILYVDTDNETKIDKIKEQYADAVKKGEVLVLPKDVAEIRDANVSPRDRLEWIRYLEGFFYQVVGVPRSLTTSEGLTEAGGKIGYLTFEPIYTKEQTDLEDDLWNQMGLKIKFNRPASLGGTVQADEQANTGQVALQPNDVAATLTQE